RPLSGVSLEVEITVHVSGQKPARWRGSLLWTHFGISGPVAMNASGTWHRAKRAGQEAQISVNLLSDETFKSAEAAIVETARARPRSAIHTLLAEWLSGRLAEAVLNELHIERDIPLAHFSRDDRRRLIHALLAWPLPVLDSRGYNYAEVTSGGVPLSEI